MAPSPWKAKAKATSNPDARRRALEHSIASRNKKRQRRAERRSIIEGPRPLNTPQAIDEPPSDEDDDHDESDHDAKDDAIPRDRREEDWAAMQRANEAMSQELAHLRAMVEHNDQLTYGATPGASGSRSRSREDVHDRTDQTPVALGDPALDDAATYPHVRARPSPSHDREPRRFVPIPKSKTSANIDDIQHNAGLGNNQPRWLEISNVIRELMTRVGVDYTNPWLHQDKSKLGILYSLILQEAPELGVFRNGWATEWLVQNKFNNHRYYMTRRGKRRHLSVEAENDVQHHGPPPPLELRSLQPAPKPSPPPSPPRFSASPPPEPAPLPEPEPEPEPPRPQTPPQEPTSLRHPSLSPPTSPRLQREQPQEAIAPRLSHPPQDSNPAQPPTDRSSSSRRGRSRTRRSYGNPGASGSRYSLRTRAAAAAAAEAQTTAAIEEANRPHGDEGGTSRRSKKRSRRSESPLRPLEESDDGGRSTDEDY